MREIYKTYSQKGKKQVKITTISVALLVAATFILSAASPVMAIQTHTTKLNVNAPEVEIQTTELAPRAKEVQSSADLKSAGMIQVPIGDECYTMYGEHAISGGGGELYHFETCDPSDYEEIGNSQAGYFLSGGTYGCDGIWYGVQYDNGILWAIDPYSGDMYSVGGGGVGLNTLAYNPTDNRMYGLDGSDNLIEVDPDTGEQENLGSLGSALLTIGMAFNADGELYAWELVTDHLWKIDVEDVSREDIGPLDININYAQDGDFHRESGVLYLTGYVSTGALYTCDITSGHCEYVANLPNGWETTNSIFLNTCEPLDHDVAIRSIDSPQSGRAEPDMDMTITVKNVGNNTETFDAQMEIIKCESGPLVYEEYFDTGVMPEGWETDWWTIYNSNNAGGDPYEARAYYYDQYGSGSYYDNYIMSPQTDCTGLEKVNLRFRWAATYYYAQYCSIYVKFRRNETSPWKDVSPWDNPQTADQDGQLYEIGCYGFGEPMGEEFQMMWQFIGYSYYYYYFYLDDVTLEACGGCAEYAQLAEDITLAKGEETQISFPAWTPSEWHNESSENTWEEYPLHAFILLDGDQNPRNDDKWVLIDLWYPWMHDVEVMSIDSPHDPEGRSLPGQTFPVQATMRNVGQYPECCIPIDLNIGNPWIGATALDETEWEGTTNPYGSSYQNYYPGYDTGWRDEHDYIAYYYGWWRSSTSNSGGSPYEAYLPYYYCYQDYHFYSAALDTSEFETLDFRFLSYINHYSGTGLYALEAGYSFDLVTWYAAWHEEPGSSQGYDIDVPISVDFAPTTYIGFWVKGDPFYFNYWYIDNIELVSTGYTHEYDDFACQGPDLEPGEEATFTFNDWTPAFLAEETTGSQDYIIEATIEMEGDKNPGNDIKIEELTLDYWWDIGIDKITSPSGGHADRLDELLYDNGDPNGVNGLGGSYYLGNSNIIIDDFYIDDQVTITGVQSHFCWNSGYSENMDKVKIYVIEELGDCDPDPSYECYAEVEATSFVEYTTGTYYFGRPEVIVEAEFDGIPVGPGHWWIGIQPDGIADDIAYMLTADLKDCCLQWDGPTWGYARWTPGSNLGYNYDIAWAIYGGKGGAPSPKAWIQPGTEDIDATVMNYGTFPKEDLICYAEIWEYITDPENGTQLYSDEISNIDLTTPLGGSRNLQFADFTFADEGRYGLFLDFPSSPDDVEKNNAMAWGVAVDDTRPDCDYPPIYDPAVPNGEAGWYVDDVTITLNASDPMSNGVSSGVKEIRYTVNGGNEEVISGSTGSFILTQDGNDIAVEYWAVDWVGNVEATKNAFTIDIDQTVPDVDLIYEVLGWTPLEGWEFQFTATASDAMSGMNRVEFYFNNQLQETVNGTGPDYVWTLFYFPLPGKAIFTAVAYDNAGLFNSDDIINPEASSYSTPQTQQSLEVPRTQPLPR